MISDDWKIPVAVRTNTPVLRPRPHDPYVVDLIQRSPIVVADDATALVALGRAREADVHYLVVLHAEEVVGICCRCDLTSASTTALVADVMTAPAEVIDDQATGLVAVETMRGRSVGCLPIVDWAGHLKGVLTLSDLVRAGLLDSEEVPMCASCGARHGLVDQEPSEVPFCRSCLEQSRPPRRAGDDLYFTLGGGD
jgi:CBS domain-containing protein